MGDAVGFTRRLDRGVEGIMPGSTDKSDAEAVANHFDVITNGIATDSSRAQSPKDAPKTNGVHALREDSFTNGVTAKCSGQSDHVNGRTESFFGQLPPEIEHISLGYRPTSVLIERIVQETFISLGDVLGGMVDIPILQQQPNGLSSHTPNRQLGGISADSSQPNVRKKSRFFDWANSRRAQFIKALVLAKWARQAESLSKVIDLRIWLVQRQTDYSDAAHWIGALKRNLAPLKQHDPDIATALEVLSLGRASWIPDLGYIPEEQFTPKQMLDGLRRINALLSIRLNLHEKIPPVLTNFSVASGRATFRIPDECEIDVSIADEDFTKQLYFVDLRFTFSPAQPQIPLGRIRDELEFKANDILGREGLSGLCDHLHNHILTQKLLVLRQQAFDMARNHWAGQIIVEPVRRAVVVQYWSDRPGQKSWMEIAIKRDGGRLLLHTEREQKFPGLSLRWFRNGKEVRDVHVDIRPGNLSLQYILEQIIAQHTDFIMSELISQLRQCAIFASNALRLKISENASSPRTKSLLIQLTQQRAIKLLKEPVSGTASILPSSELSARAEHELNRLPSLSSDGAGPILQLRSRIAHQVIEALAVRLGWEVSRSFKLDMDSFQTLFPKGTQQVRYYRRQSWHHNWLLAFSTSPDGDTWWAVEGANPGSSDSVGLYKAASGYTTALKIPQVDADASLEASEASLTHIERTAIGIISQYVDTRHLASLRIPHKIQAGTSASAVQRFPSLYLRLPKTSFTPALLKSPGALAVPWAHEVVKVDYQGLNSSHSSCVQRASCRVAQSFSDLKDLASNMKGAAFNQASGAFTLQLRTKVGEASVPQLLHRIAGIGRLHEFVAVIKAQKLSLDKFSMGSLTFTYQQSPQILKASIIFPADNTMRLSLSAPNPHLRIIDHLNSTLRAQGLASVLPLLSITQPLLSGLTQLEQNHPSGDVSIISRSEQAYQVRYISSNSIGSFDLQLKRRRDEYDWLIPEQSIHRPDPGFEEDKWRESLKPVTRGTGPGWHGVNGGIIASLSGVSDALQRLDSIFLESKSHASQAPPSKLQPRKSRPGKRKAEGEPSDPLVID